ncbi:hypothetical protein MMC29_007019, partial [Sticta canariensis]|nr:hypothetical protein [Sticta canariensis]
QRMLRYGASLSPLRFPDPNFKEFKREHAHAKQEAQVTGYVIPLIEGETRDGNCRSGQIRFTNLAHLTDGSLASGSPDLFHDSPPRQLNRMVRGELSSQIMPST